jgi:predicted dehydrogenase
VPSGFNWDLWLGVNSTRPFIGNAYYHPANWRKRLDFGTGTFGDMGCHIFDPVFSALELHSPISVRSEGVAPNQWNWAMDSKIHYVFPGSERTADKTLPVSWYDGEAKPAPEILKLLEGDERPNSGSMFVGTEGVLVLPHWSRPLLYPDAKFKDFKFPDVPGADHWEQFLLACQGKAKTMANFGYAGPLTETVLLGGVASRFPQTTLKWNSAKLKFDEAEANHFIRRKYREGWTVKGLS